MSSEQPQWDLREPKRRRFQYSLRSLLLLCVVSMVVMFGIKTWLINRSHGRMSLCYAADVGDLDEIQWLLDHGADINQVDISDTPLIFAAGRGYSEIVKYLVSRGADVNKGREKHRSALIQAICNHHPDLANWLIDQGADVTVTESSGDSVLHFAAQYGNAQIAERLIDKGADINAKGGYGRTPLYTTLIYRSHGFGDYSVAEVLLKKGADPNITTEESVRQSMGNTPLGMAEYYQLQPMITLLKQYGAK
jgi:uncharacterized protein